METQLESPKATETTASEMILVVDDDEGVRETVVDILQTGGQQCVAVGSVAEALDMLTRTPVDLIITDMHMPGQSGLDLIEKVQTLDDSIPVILITGFPSVHSAINALKKGAIEFISKPFDFESITQIVAKALRERRLRQELKRLQAESHKAELIEKLNRQLGARLDELTHLYTISEGIANFMDTASLMDQVVKLAAQVTGAQRVSLMMLDRGRSQLRIRSAIGISDEVIRDTRVRVGHGISGKAIQDGRLVRATRHVHQNFRSAADTLGLGLYQSHSWMSAPLRVGGQIFGVLNLTDKPDRSDFSSEEEQLVSVLVEKAGTKLENQALYEGIYASLVDTLNSLVTTIEAKDPYTREHSHRVAEYSVIIGSRVGLTDEQLELLEFAAILHDIGKIGVRDEILTKTGRLTDEEYDAIKQHTIIGEKIAEPLGLSADERAVIRSHHERYDGTGYPDGLRGENIPLLARVAAIADAFDAMTSTRPYRKARTAAEAGNEIEKLYGAQFDPKFAAAAVQAIRDGRLKVKAGTV